MSYAVASDVQGLNAKRTAYSASTLPTLTQVNGFITQIAGEIDSILAAMNVLTPVTAPASMVSFLQFTNALGAAALADAAQFPEFDGGAGHTTHAAWLWSLYETRCASLMDGSAIDPNTTQSGPDALARTYLTDNPDNGGDDGADGFTDGQQPIFSVLVTGREF